MPTTPRKPNKAPQRDPHAVGQGYYKSDRYYADLRALRARLAADPEFVRLFGDK